MKAYQTIIFCIFFISCSKKTHVLNKAQTSSHLQKTTNSVNKKNLLYRDKSIITTDIDLDTSIRVTGKPLLGSFNLTHWDKHFENDDLSIDFVTDKLGSDIAFKAYPKEKTVNARYHQKTTKQNDIIKTDVSKLSIWKKAKLQQDSIYTHIVDHQDPTIAVNSIKSAAIWVIIVLIIAATGFFVLKRRII